MSALGGLRLENLPAIDKAAAQNGRLSIFSEPRTGKTRTALAIAEKLESKRIMVVGMNSFLQVWEDECEKVNFALPVERLTNPNQTIVQRAQELIRIRKAGESKLLAVNYEGWWRKDLRAAIRAWEPDLIVYDEAHRLVERGNKSARFAHQIANREKWFKSALSLTATWQEGGYEDVFSLYKATDPSVFGSDFPPFQYKYCKMGGYLGKEIVDYKNLDELFETVRRTSFYLSQAQLGIPSPTFEIIEVDLTPGTRSQYEQFLKDKYLNFKGYEDQTLEVFYRLPISALVKAEEITGGWIQNDDGKPLDISSEKLDAAVAYAKNEMRNGRQHAIYCAFSHDIERLARALDIPLALTYSGLAGTGLKGEINRQNALKSLRNGSLPILIGNIDMIAQGIDLSCCQTAGFYSVDWSYIKFFQLWARLQGKGVYPHHVIYEAKNTIDQPKYALLRKKTALASKVFNL